SVTAVTGPTGLLSWTGSAINDPPAGATEENVPVLLSCSIPSCRFVLPVVVVTLPIVMLPWVELVPRQNGIVFLPSVPSIDGSSTGQRENGAHAPGPAWSSWSAPVLVPALLVATTRKW